MASPPPLCIVSVLCRAPTLFHGGRKRVSISFQKSSSSCRRLEIANSREETLPSKGAVKNLFEEEKFSNRVNHIFFL